jgi:putative ABC transport system ATP-binding protein
MSTTPGDTLIDVQQASLHFDRGKIRALNGIDLSVREGEFVAVVGPSGCGKTSLLNLIGTLDAPTSGEIYFRSRPYSTIRDSSDFRRKHFGFVFQSFHLIPTLTALDNVLVATVGCSGSAHAYEMRARDLLAQLGLEDRISHLPSDMSGGERQRAAIARALINEPDVLLADEPTGSLDSASAARLLDVIAQIRKWRNLTVMLVTHEPQISAWADRIVRVRDGRVDTTTRTP